MRNTLLACASALVAVSLPLAGAVAQDPSGVVNTPGARVRVITTGKGPEIVGTLIARHGDSLFVARFADTAFVLQEDVKSYEISAGKHHQVGKSIGFGVLTGAAVGGAIGAFTYSPCHSTEFLGCFMTPSSRAESTAWGGVLGLSAGGLIGLVVGVFAEFDTWVASPLPKTTSALHVMPSRNGFSVSLTLPLRH
jgi:hypothetical protein